MKSPLLPILSFCVAWFAAQSNAAVLISESFSSGYTVGSLIGQTASGTGLSGTWSAAIVGAAGNTTGVAYTSSGLSFGTLATSGGAMTMTIGNTVNTGGNTLIVGANTSTFGTITGTLYASYIYQVSTAGTGFVAASHAFNQRIGTSATSASSVARFTLNPDNTATGTTAGVDYIGNTYGAGNTGGTAYTAGTTYFTVGSFTNVGTAGGGTARMITLNLAQYNNWQSGGGSESSLFSRTLGTGANQALVSILDTVATQANFVGGTATFLQTSMNMGTAVGSYTTIFDEFKYATTFAEVIPEPSAPLMLISSLGTFALLRRRRA